MGLDLSSDFDGNRIQAIVDEHINLEGPLLPILHAVQEDLGCIPQEALPVIANKLNLNSKPL